MADDKVKRFRVHVIKEICNTEKDYLQKLQFVVKVREIHYSTVSQEEAWLPLFRTSRRVTPMSQKT